MQTLPFKARIYLLLIWLAALLTAGWAMSIRLPRSDAQFWEGILFAVLAVIAYGKKIVLMQLSSEEDSVTISFGCVITFAALLRLGPLDAVVIAVAGCLFSCVYPNYQRGFQIAFNVAVAVLATWLAGLTFLYLNTGDLSLYPAHTIPAVAVASVVYFLVNTGAMAVNNSLCTDQKILPLWREDFLWTAPGYFVGAGVGTLVVVACGSGCLRQKNRFGAAQQRRRLGYGLLRLRHHICGTSTPWTAWCAGDCCDWLPFLLRISKLSARLSDRF